MEYKILLPYQNPIECARCFTSKDLKAQLRMAEKILESADEHKEWLERTFICWKKFILEGDSDSAIWWSEHADFVRPSFLTKEYCDACKAELYKKNPEKYPQFHDYCRGETEGKKEA